MKKLLVLLILLLPILCRGQSQVQITGTLVVQSTPLSISFPANIFTKAYQNIPFTGPIRVLGGVAPYTCTVNSGSLPTGLSITGCTISGTPTSLSSFSAVIRATDSLSQHVDGTLEMTASSLVSIAVTGSSLTVAISATQQLMGTGTWSDSTTSDLTTTCTWSSGTGGVATIGAATGLVTGVAGGTSLMSCVFNAITGSATITVTANPSVATATTDLTHAKVNLPYAPFTLQATGGTPPFTWAVTVGALPTGLSLASTTGVISGTPTGTTTTFSVVATDSLSVATAAKSLTLTVATVSSNAVVCTPSTITAGTTSQCVSTTTFSDASTADTSMGSTLAVVNTARASNATGTLVSSIQTGAFAATTGNMLIVGARHGTDFVSGITVTDTAGNTFTAIGSLTPNSPNLGVAQMFYAKNITGNVANRVTCTFAAPVAYNSCVVLQVVGANTSTPLDAHSETGVGASSTNSCISGSVTTTLANSILASHCSAASLNAVFSSGASYNLDVQDADGLSSMESKVASAIQTGVTATTSFNGAAKPTIGLVATFKAATAAGAAWSSGTPSTATVTGGGLVTGLVSGSSVITAIYGGQTGTATVTVTGGAVTSITVTPATISGPNGSTQQFTARDQNAGDITGSVAWASTQPSCVTMSPAGLATVVSSTACGSSNNITATSGQVSGFATFTGTGTPTGAGLLSGCTVSSSNVPNCATPSGWTLVSGVSFEDNTLGNGNTGLTGVPTSVVSNFGHTGTHSWMGLLSGDNKTFQWDSPDLIGFQEAYLSYWEYDDSTALFNSELFAGGIYWPSHQQFYALDWQQLSRCGTSTLGNNPSSNLILVWGGSQGSGSGQDYFDPSACLPLNSPSWGNWTQYELYVKMDSGNVALGTPNDGTYQVYRNGVLISHCTPNSGSFSGGGICSNVSGNGGNLKNSSHKAYVGGANTDIVAFQDAAKTICSIQGQGQTNFFFRPTNANSISPCPAQEPPNGFFNSSVAGGFHRWFDDIIILKR